MEPAVRRGGCVKIAGGLEKRRREGKRGKEREREGEKEDRLG